MKFHTTSINIRKVLKKIQPAVQSNGGNLEVVRVRNGVVTIRVKGNCAGCPVSILGLEDNLKTILQGEIPEIRKVEIVI